MKTTAFLFCMSLLLAGCQTVPTAPKILEVCPKIPMLELSLPTDALERPFFDRMQSFLSGRLPEQISYELHSNPASQPTIRLDAK